MSPKAFCATEWLLYNLESTEAQELQEAIEVVLRCLLWFRGQRTLRVVDLPDL